MIAYYRTAELPDVKLWLLDDDGDLVNFSTGYTFVFKIGRLGEAAQVTKSTGITGAAGAGVEPTGTPNVVVTFGTGELDGIAAGQYKWQLRATASGSLDRVYGGDFQVFEVIS